MTGSKFPRHEIQIQVRLGGQAEDPLQRCLLGRIILHRRHQEAALLARVVGHEDLRADREALHVPEDCGADTGEVDVAGDSRVPRLPGPHSGGIPDGIGGRLRCRHVALGVLSGGPDRGADADGRDGQRDRRADRGGDDRRRGVIRHLGDRAVEDLPVLGEGLGPQEAEQHLVPRDLLGVVLEAVALEVLHGVGLAIGGVDLGELLGQGEAEDREAAIALPVAQEGAAQGVAGLTERGAVGGAGVGRGAALRAVPREVVAEEGQQHLVLRLVLRVPLHDRALVVLHDQAAIVHEGLADRQAEDLQAAVRLPEGEEGVLGAVGDAGRAIARAGGGALAGRDGDDGAEGQHGGQ